MLMRDVFKERRVVKFYLPMDVVRSIEAEVLKEFMSQFFVTRAEYLFDGDYIDYIVYCESFESVEQGIEPPRYGLYIYKDMVDHSIVKMCLTKEPQLKEELI